MAPSAPIVAPVSRSSSNPVKRERMIAKLLDMKAGLDPVRPELSRVELVLRASSQLIADTLMQAPSTTIVTTGPLTNLALFLVRYPARRHRIQRVVMPGGALSLGQSAHRSDRRRWYSGWRCHGGAVSETGTCTRLGCFYRFSQFWPTLGHACQAEPAAGRQRAGLDVVIERRSDSLRVQFPKQRTSGLLSALPGDSRG